MATEIHAVVRKLLHCSLLISTGLLLSCGPPLPLFIGDGHLASAATGPDGRVHVLFQDDAGVKYGVIDLMTLSSETVAAEGVVRYPGLRGCLAFPLCQYGVRQPGRDSLV